MATVARFGLSKFIANPTYGRSIIKINVRTITSELNKLPPKPKPWNYNEEKFSIWKRLYDKTTSRLDENSKLIVVEGPVASGKSKVAKEIAKTFGMLYLPEANLDMAYTNSYGYNLKKLDPLLPPDTRSFDVQDFLKNPQHKLTARMQFHIYTAKFSQHIDALAHILSTGQGVVLDRCAYSDFVIMEAMYSQNFISKGARRKYYELRDNTLPELMKPHLIVYLDVPVQKCLENIKKRNISYEVNSPAMNENYLKVMEKYYKQDYLKDISNDAELLVYDWTEEGDMEVVLEDIEAVDFDKYDVEDRHFDDWKIEAEWEWAYKRQCYADQKNDIMLYTDMPIFDVPELLVEALDYKKYLEVIDTAPGEQYLPGYNSDLGDSGILFKSKEPNRRTLPLIERRL